MSMATAVMPVALGGRQGGPEAVQAGLLAVVGQVEHPGPLQIGHDRQIPMPLGDGLLVDPEPGDHLVAPPRQAPLDRAPLDPPALVPTDAEQPDRARDRALAQQINGQPLEQRGELRARLGPRHPELLDPVRGALDPRHVGLDPGRELHRVQMAPAAGLAVIPRPGRPALRTRVRPRPRVHPHHHPLPGHVHVDAGDRPRRGQPQERSIQLDVAFQTSP